MYANICLIAKVYVDEKIQGRILDLLSIGKDRPSKIKKKKQMDEIEKIFVWDTSSALLNPLMQKLKNMTMTNILLIKSHQDHNIV